MNSTPVPRRLALAMLMLGFVTTVGCSKLGKAVKDPSVDYYTCTMHPSVHSQDPDAKCPICSMDLVPVYKKDAKRPGAAPATPKVTEPETSLFGVPVERQQQIGVTYARVEVKPLTKVIHSVGFIAPDKTRRSEFVARVEGYIQKLRVSSPGEEVERDQPLITLYSPELLTAQREFVNLLQTRDRAQTTDARENAARLIAASRLRLEQWNVSAKQIDELEKSRTPSEFLTLYSPFKGVVEDVPVNLGRKVMPGDRLVGIADLSVVWVWAEFYEDELPLLKKGSKVVVFTPSCRDQSFEGEIAIIDPFLDPVTRTAKARIDLPNPELKLQPGMYANVDLSVDAGEGLAVPVSAIMPTGARSLVFIDKGEGRLEPRFIQIGDRYGSFYAVEHGLEEGERVVASANFLIDAESKVQGAIKTFEEPAK